jgi:phosphoribosyl 1,2-cyclic phosphodiesterase
MVRMTVLASGSRGNCTVVSAGRTSVLVDAGVSCREILKRMQLAGEDPAKLNAILITHEHQDHVQGLSVLARRLGIPVYFTAATHRAWMRWMVPQKRMTYADWLASRKAEMAARAEAAELAQRSGNAAQNASASAADMHESAGAANPLYREAGLAECAAEQEEFARQIAAGEAAQTTVQPQLGDLEAAVGEQRLQATKTASLSDRASGVKPGPAAAPSADPCALPGVEFFEAGKTFSLGDLRITPFTIPHDAVDPVGFVLEGEGMRLGLATDLGYMPANVAQQLRRCDVLMLESNHDLDMLRDGPYPWSVKQRVLSRVGHLSNTAAADFLEKSYDGQAAYVVLAHLSSSNNLPELARVAAEWALRERMQLLANRVLVAEQDVPTPSICL